MSNEAVQVLVVWSLDSKVSATDVIDGFVVDHETAVGMLEGCVRSEDRVIGLHNRGSDLRSRVHAEFELALLAVVDRETLHQQRAESRSSTAAERVEHQEALKARAVVGNTSNLVQHLVDELFANSVVSTCIIV